MRRMQTIEMEANFGRLFIMLAAYKLRSNSTWTSCSSISRANLCCSVSVENRNQTGCDGYIGKWSHRARTGALFGTIRDVFVSDCFIEDKMTGQQYHQEVELYSGLDFILGESSAPCSITNRNSEIRWVRDVDEFRPSVTNHSALSCRNTP